MCTAISYEGKKKFFGRNLDLEYFYDEAVTITPRNYRFKFRQREEIKSHLAIIGMAYVCDGYPLYYDAMNEKGLAMAGLSFPGFAKYNDIDYKKENITPFEIIPYVLGLCNDIYEARKILKNINMVNINFSKGILLTPMHFIISDGRNSIVLETKGEKISVYDNPIGVLTNSPSFDYQLFNLNNYMKVSRKTPENLFNNNIELYAYSRGMGGMGLPGDLSSLSRFVRASFVKSNIIKGDTGKEDIMQFFHILDSVEQQKGCVEVNKNEYEYTIYSSCMDLEKGIYYYKTYYNSQIIGVNMNKENLDEQYIKKYKILKKTQIYYQN